MATTDIYTIEGGLYPYKQGCRFLGGNVDDQIEINASGVGMVAGNFTTGTLSAWIMVPNDSNTYTVISYGDDNVVEYITIDVVSGKLRAICCVNTVVQWSYITTNVEIKPHRWYHIAVVQDGTRPAIYIDKELPTITRTTDTDCTAWFDETTGIDAGSIGAFEGNGDASLTQEFAGYISDVRVWGGTTSAAALTQEQIAHVMDGGSVGTPLNWWPLDGDALDHGSGADNGTIVGDIIYCTGSEFASRMSFGCGTMVVADSIHLAANNTTGLGLVIQAA